MRKNFVYTQTRLQARHGQRPSERTWRLLESQKDLANFLQSARHSSVGQWVTGLQASNNHHFIESTLLSHYRSYVNEVASWAPDQWRKSVRWVVCLTYLPVIDHLLKGNTGYNWMLDDVTVKPATTTMLDQRMAYLLQTEFAPLFKYKLLGNSLLDAWIQHWRYLWPERKGRATRTFDHFIQYVQAHRELFMQLPVDRTWRQREQLTNKLTIMFRREAYQPVNVFVHLLLVALDLERLRAAILQRHLFGDYQEIAS